MIVTITDVTQEFAKNGSEYLKIKGTTPDGKETTKSIFDSLADSWSLLKEGAVIDFEMEKKGQFWNVIGISPVDTTKPSPDAPQSKSSPPTRGMDTNASIESQVAIKAIVELVVADKVKTADRMYKTLENWVMSKLSYWSSQGGEIPEAHEKNSDAMNDLQREIIKQAVKDRGLNPLDVKTLIEGITNGEKHMTGDLTMREAGALIAALNEI